MVCATICTLTGCARTQSSVRICGLDPDFDSGAVGIERGTYQGDLTLYATSSRRSDGRCISGFQRSRIVCGIWARAITDDVSMMVSSGVPGGGVSPG